MLMEGFKMFAHVRVSVLLCNCGFTHFAVSFRAISDIRTNEEKRKPLSATLVELIGVAVAVV